MFKTVNFTGTAENSRGVLAANIIDYRKERGISRECFAEICDISQRHVTDIEKCRTTITIDTLDKIAAGTHLHTTYWLTVHTKE